jgi:hypothetical protein
VYYCRPTFCVIARRTAGTRAVTLPSVPSILVTTYLRSISAHWALPLHALLVATPCSVWLILQEDKPQIKTGTLGTKPPSVSAKESTVIFIIVESNIHSDPYTRLFCSLYASAPKIAAASRLRPRRRLPQQKHLAVRTAGTPSWIQVCTAPEKPRRVSAA